MKELKIKCRNVKFFRKINSVKRLALYTFFDNNEIKKYFFTFIVHSSFHSEVRIKKKKGVLNLSTSDMRKITLLQTNIYIYSTVFIYK